MHRTNLPLLLPLLGTLFAAAQTASSQAIQLYPNWNLISFQVVPTNPAPAAVWGSLVGFQAAWTWDVTAGCWTRYVKSTDPLRDSLENSLPGLGMGPITPGRAYWVYGSGMPSP